MVLSSKNSRLCCTYLSRKVSQFSLLDNELEVRGSVTCKVRFDKSELLHFLKGWRYEEILRLTVPVKICQN